MSQTPEEAALRAKLVKSVVLNDVLLPMEANGWAQGSPNKAATEALRNTLLTGQPGTEGAPGQQVTPASTPRSGQPANAEAGKTVTSGQAKADNPTLDQLVAGYESLRDPKTGLIAGKYESVEQAIKGGVHLTKMAKSAMEERDALAKRLAELEAAGSRTPAAQTPAAAPKPVAALTASQTAAQNAQARLDKVLSDIAESGGVLDAESVKALSKANSDLASAMADLRVQESFATRENADAARDAEWRAVDSYMKEHHPDAERFSEEVSVFVSGNPLVKRAVDALLAQGDKVGATEFAWTSFQKIHGAEVTARDRAKDEATEAELAAREQVRQEQLAKARKDAGVITGSAGGVGAHENRNVTGASREEIAAAMEQMRREGEAPGSPAAQLFRKMVIGPSLGFLNGQ